VAAETIEQLGRWPDPAPVESLLAVLQDRAKAGWRRRALASVIQLATVAADEHQRPDETVIGWFRRAGLAAQSPEERRAIVSGLGRIKHPESLRLLKPYLDDPGVQNEAAIAILQMAPAVRQADPAGLKQALERIAAAAPNPEMRQQAAKIAGTIPQPTPP
jgi:HEAT repeat protein